MNNPQNQYNLPGLIVNAVRHYRPGWDTPGVLKAVKAALALYEPDLVRMAAIDAAKDQQVRTPGAIDARCQHLLERQRRGVKEVIDPDAPPVNFPRDLPANHCGNPACSCSHDECFAGWVGVDTRPCPDCRPALTERWLASSVSGGRPPLSSPTRSADTTALLRAQREQIAARRRQRLQPPREESA